MTTITMTRADYLEQHSADEAKRRSLGQTLPEFYSTQHDTAHKRYFSQFVTHTVKKRVLDALGIATIMASQDPFMNDIPLSRWERLAPAVFYSDVAVLLQAAGETETPSVAVAILKQAAQRVKLEAVALFDNTPE